MSGISYNYIQIHTNGSNLNRQGFFVDDLTKFHVARCCLPKKCNLNFKHINDNDNDNDDKTAILWFRFYHIQVRMTGL